VKYLENSEDVKTDIEVYLDGDEIKYQIEVHIGGKEKVSNILTEGEMLSLYSTIEAALKSPMTKRLRKMLSRECFFG
jgi:ribosome-associated translation inhibitor RaiA